MDVLRMLRPLVHASGPEVQLPGRELLGLVVAAESAPLYPSPPEWVQGVATLVGAREGVSAALLEAISGELTGWQPGSGPFGPGIGLMGLPMQLLEDGQQDSDLVASLPELEAGDRAAAERVHRNVATAARYIRADATNARLVHVLEYYVGLGTSEGPGGGPARRRNRETVRRIMGRYLWRLLEQLPAGRAAELLDSFEPPDRRSA